MIGIKAPKIVEAVFEWVFSDEIDKSDKEEVGFGWALVITGIFVLWWLIPAKLLTTKVVLKK